MVIPGGGEGVKDPNRSSRSLHLSFHYSKYEKREWRCKEGDLILRHLFPPFHEVLMRRRTLLVQGCAPNNYLYKHCNTIRKTKKEIQKRKTRFSNPVPYRNCNEYFFPTVPK